MSKECQQNNLRLLGSPVNLSYRKKKDDKKNIRNRPRSALQNSGFTPVDTQERHRRPFSADAKEHVPSTRTFLKTFTSDLMDSYNNPQKSTQNIVFPSWPQNKIKTASTNMIKIVAPTTELLGDTKSHDSRTQSRGKDICSNTSDHGSEDTFISLGTKIKARAQSPKAKSSNCKNFIKYRNTVKKNKKPPDNSNEPKNNVFNIEVKFDKRDTQDNTNNRNLYEERTPSPCFKSTYQTYFLPLHDENKAKEESLLGRVSFGGGPLHSEVEQAIDTYSRRLNLTKQQLSLVEEESTQGSVHSPRPSSLTTENSDELHQKDNKDEDTGDTYVVDTKTDFPKSTNECGPRTYNSFYEDFQSSGMSYSMSSTVVPHDGSSKDSGYTDSGGANDDKTYRRGYPTLYRKSNSAASISQPKSLQNISNDGKDLKTFPLDKNWVEPINHSRLLYKDFFLKKEGHIAKAPQNSPIKAEESIPGTSQSLNNMKADDDDKSEYPTYLLNSNTKAYTSKVIEDYKKEIQAINNLHELTLKDIKTDAVSPTPLNIDKMFDQHSNISDDRTNTNEIPQEVEPVSIPDLPPPKPEKKPSLPNKNDICDVSTRELIKKYLKVKDGDYTKEFHNRNLKKPEKKVNNLTPKMETWGNKSSTKTTAKSSQSCTNIKNGIIHVDRKSNNIPLSARTEDAHKDKDIESWMSMSAPSPRILELEDIPSTTNDVTNESNSIMPEKQSPKSPKDVKADAEVKEVKTESKNKQLNSSSTVLDIFSMLKEIESFGEQPVTIVARADTETTKPKEEEGSGDNFTEIFQFLESVEQSANDALAGVTNTTPQNMPRLEALLKLPQTELAQRLVTSLLQLEERSCCIALLQESLTNHKEQTLNKISNLEKQANRNISRVKSECEEAIKRHQTFIDQLITDKQTLNHRIEQLVDERRSLEERWRRAARSLEERYQLQLRNQHDKMQAQQQVARQRWVRQKAEKIKELTIKGLEGELREMADRQQKELADLQMSHAEYTGRLQSKHGAELEQLRRDLEAEREAALVKERQLAATRMEKQIMELEAGYAAQRARLVAEMRAENERVASGLCEQERTQRETIEKWREEQEKILEEKKAKADEEIERKKQELEHQVAQKRVELENEFLIYKTEFEASQQLALKAKVTEIANQHKRERDKEIEKAIESMEAEAQTGRKELQDALRRNKEQYEIELSELAQTEQATLRRYKEAQARVRDTEDRCAELEVTINQLQTKNKVLTEKNSELEKRGEEVRQSCEATWSDRVEELKREADETKRTHEEQMHQLYAKVKIAVARKDSAIQALTREAAKYQEKITLLEQKLQQQRKDYFKHK